MAEYAGIQLAQLVNMDNVDAVFEEVKYNFIQSYPVAEFLPVRRGFRDFKDLYDGKYPGYRACNTRYHDELHTTDALLAISRLIDGFNIKKKKKIPADLAVRCLIATIFHDSGYIQSAGDTRGTGAKYTLSHVKRSVEFLRNYFKSCGLPQADAESAGRMVQCTGLSTDITSLKFKSGQEEVLGYMLGAADLLGQMASRTYLERLGYLYKEFREGHVEGCTSENALLESTLKFYDTTDMRLKEELKGVDRFALYHFRKRYGINHDLYRISIVRQMGYLRKILSNNSASYRDKLKRMI